MQFTYISLVHKVFTQNQWKSSEINSSYNSQTHVHTPLRWLVFGGAISALGLMTFLSVCLGFATMIIPRAVTFYICTALLALFGLKMLYEGWKMSADEGKEEFEEVSEELRKKEEMVRTHL